MCTSLSFSNCYDFVMQGLEKSHLHARRSRLLKGLTGSVLEIGVGTGVNFEHYNNSVQVIGIEPSSGMLQLAEKKREKSLAGTRIQLLNVGWEDPTLLQHIATESLDAIVCTLVMCTIPASEKAVVQFSQWLKPHGKLILLEHIQSPRSVPAAFQQFINPLWRQLAGGCNLTRKSDQLAELAGFKILEKSYFKYGISFVEATYQKEVSTFSTL